MKKPSPLVIISARFGAFAAFLSVAAMTLMYYLGRHPLMVAPFLDFRIILYGIFIFFSLKEYREFHKNGVLYFWQGMIGSFIVVATAAMLGSILIRIFGSVEINFIPSYITAMTEYLEAFPEADIKRLGRENFERNLSELQSTNISQIASLYIAQSFGIGLFISIILSVILRKQPKSI